MNKGKKLFALCVSAMLLMGTMPAMALANNDDTTNATTKATTSQADDATGKSLQSVPNTGKAQSDFVVDNNGVLTAYHGVGGDVVIPKSIGGVQVTKIATNTFADFTSITTITIPNSVTYISSDAFANCTGITEYIFMCNTAPVIENTSIYKKGFTAAVIFYVDGASGFNTGLWANFDYNCIPLSTRDTFSEFNYYYNNGKVTITGYKGSKTNVIIPEGTHHIVYVSDSVTGLTIPKTVESIDEQNYKHLTNLNMADDNTNFYNDKQNGILYSSDKTKLLFYLRSNTATNFNVPSTATYIGSGAFANNNYLESVTIENNITAMYESAFYNCSKLKEVEAPISLLLNYSHAGFRYFEKCKSLSKVTMAGNAPNRDEIINVNGNNCLKEDVFNISDDVFETEYPNLTLYYNLTATGYTTPVWMDFPCYPVGTTPNPPTPPTTPPTEEPTPPTTEKPTPPTEKPTPPAPSVPKLNTSIVNGAPGGKIVSRIVLPGDTKGFEYKFVWSYNNWAKWGVISDFSSRNPVSFKPVRSGKYDIYVDIKDRNGNITTMSNKFDITLDKASDAKVSTTNTTAGKPVTIEGSSTGMNAQYKFVWSRNNWENGNWGVFREFSTNNKYTFTPTKAGTYEFFVDVKDSYGNITTKKQVVTVKPNFTPTLDLSSKKPAVNNKIVMNANASGKTEGLQYKFVWSYNNWQKWGVSKNFSKDTAASFMPKWPGKYEMYVDVMDKDGNVITQSKVINISK